MKTPTYGCIGVFLDSRLQGKVDMKDIKYPRSIDEIFSESTNKTICKTMVHYYALMSSITSKRHSLINLIDEYEKGFMEKDKFLDNLKECIKITNFEDCKEIIESLEAFHEKLGKLI